MRSRLILSAFLFLAAAPFAFAQSEPASTTTAPTSKQTTTPAPDYSRPTLLRIFVETDQGEETPPRDHFDTGLIYNVGPNRFRFVPFVTPFFLGATMPWAHVSSNSALTIDPFALNHNVMAYTPASIKDPIKTWKFNRMLKRNEREAKKARNEN